MISAKVKLQPDTVPHRCQSCSQRLAPSASAAATVYAHIRLVAAHALHFANS